MSQVVIVGRSGYHKGSVGVFKVGKHRFFVASCKPDGELVEGAPPIYEVVGTWEAGKQRVDELATSIAGYMEDEPRTCVKLTGVKDEPAFPSFFESDGRLRTPFDNDSIYTGMTLRDYFAAREPSGPPIGFEPEWFDEPMPDEPEGWSDYSGPFSDCDDETVSNCKRYEQELKLWSLRREAFRTACWRYLMADAMSEARQVRS